MQSRFEDELDPRSAIPVSDAEIEQIIQRIESRERLDTPSPQMADAVFNDAAVWFLLGIILLLRLRFVHPLAVIVVVLCATLLVTYLAVKNNVPFGFFTYRKVQERKQATRRQIENADVNMLARVVEEIAGQPIRYSEALQRRIQKDREQIAQALTELSEIEGALRDELRGTQDDALRMLLEGRRSASTRATERLEALDRELALQLREAAEAIQPVREMKERFDRLHRLSGTLSRIQSAHGILEGAESNSEQTKLEIQILRNVAQEATTKLQEIQQLVQDQERARAELDV